MRPTKGFGRLARSLSSFWERDPRSRSAVLAGLDLQAAADVLDAAPDHGQAQMAGLNGAADMLGVDADAVVVDLQDELTVAPGDADVDRRRGGVLDGVDDELLRDRQQRRTVHV